MGLSQAVIPIEYKAFLKEIKEKILSSQVKAALAVNRELITLYWEVGSRIHLKQKSEGWGAKTIENLAKDLKTSFPDMQGFSSRNLKYMVHFAREYPDFAIGQQVVAQIPWGHNILLLQKLTSLEERFWYANKTIENGWSRNVLLHWLDSDLYKREGKAITNFQTTLPSPQSDLAHQTLKDPYCFDFLALKEKFNEKELESGLLEHTQQFLLELGAGFAFVGRQYPLKISDKEFVLDLLFYHLKLRCFVVVELLCCRSITSPVELLLTDHRDGNGSSLIYVRPSSLIVIDNNADLLAAAKVLDDKLEALIMHATNSKS